MKNNSNKTIAIMIALFLIISIPASIMLQPTVSAHTPVWQIPTWAYINVGPNNVGVGQTVYVVIWLRDPMIGAALTNSARFHNYNLTITAPDKTVTTKIFDVVSDPTSSQYYTLTLLTKLVRMRYNLVFLGKPTILLMEQQHTLTIPFCPVVQPRL